MRGSVFPLRDKAMSPVLMALGLSADGAGLVIVTSEVYAKIPSGPGTAFFTGGGLLKVSDDRIGVVGIDRSLRASDGHSRLDL